MGRFSSESKRVINLHIRVMKISQITSHARHMILVIKLSSVSRPALGPTQPPVQWVPGVLSPGVKRGRGVTLTTHPHLVPRSWMSRSYTSSPPSASVACNGTALLFTHEPNTAVASQLNNSRNLRQKLSKRTGRPRPAISLLCPNYNGNRPTAVEFQQQALRAWGKQMDASLWSFQFYCQVYGCHNKLVATASCNTT
jgi:hypothetical protein